MRWAAPLDPEIRGYPSDDERAALSGLLDMRWHPVDRDLSVFADHPRLHEIIAVRMRPPGGPEEPGAEVRLRPAGRRWLQRVPPGP